MENVIDDIDSRVEDMARWLTGWPKKSADEVEDVPQELHQGWISDTYSFVHSLIVTTSHIQDVLTGLEVSFGIHKESAEKNESCFTGPTIAVRR